jgi:hypothetical protein
MCTAKVSRGTARDRDEAPVNGLSACAVPRAHDCQAIGHRDRRVPISSLPVISVVLRTVFGSRRESPPVEVAGYEKRGCRKMAPAAAVPRHGHEAYFRRFT